MVANAKIVRANCIIDFLIAYAQRYILLTD